jgi:hypothetical protein
LELRASGNSGTEWRTKSKTETTDARTDVRETATHLRESSIYAIDGTEKFARVCADLDVYATLLHSTCRHGDTLFVPVWPEQFRDFFRCCLSRFWFLCERVELRWFRCGLCALSVYVVCLAQQIRGVPPITV